MDKANSSTPSLNIKNGVIENTPELSAVLVNLLNTGFQVKKNDQKGTLTASRTGARGEVKIDFLANQLIVTKKGQVPSVVDYSELERVTAIEKEEETAA